jgi:hypothetical protein
MKKKWKGEFKMRFLFYMNPILQIPKQTKKENSSIHASKGSSCHVICLNGEPRDYGTLITEWKEHVGGCAKNQNPVADTAWECLQQK